MNIQRTLSSSLLGEFDSLSLSDTVDVLKVHDPNEKITLAKNITSNLQELHHQGHVHRSIDTECIQKNNGKYILCTSSEGGLDIHLRNERIMLGELTFIAPERFKDFRGSWFSDDIYALGVLFYMLSTEKPPFSGQEASEDLVQLKKSIIDVSEAHRKAFTKKMDSIDLLMELSLWMMHPDHKLRPTIDEVNVLLNGQSSFTTLHQFVELPSETVTSITINNDELNELEKKFDGVIPSHLCSIALKILRSKPEVPYTYISRKNLSNSNYKILVCSNAPWILFVPKKNQASDESGSFKIGRRSYFAEKVNNSWQTGICFSLTSNKMHRPAAFKLVYKKEMKLYETFSEESLFATHFETSLFNDKPHKRISFYENINSSLFEWTVNSEHTRDEKILALFRIADKVKQLHTKGYAHRDLKFENILIDTNSHIKLCDLDSMVLDKTAMHYPEDVGTRDYIPPERYGDFVGSWQPDDIYALGCVFYTLLLNRDPPWSERSDEEMLLLKMTFINEDPEHPLEDMIYQMMHPDRTKRPSIETIYDRLNEALQPQET